MGTLASQDRRLDEREEMVANQIQHRGIKDPLVIAALRAVPRHRFVPEGQQAAAYADAPLPIGSGQTISQPYIVAYMTAALELRPTDRVLEVGTGSGYQAAILSRIAAEVYSIERLDSFKDQVQNLFARLGYTNISFRIGDGSKGWPEAAPFDAILVTAAGPRLPQPLVEQLAKGGRLVMPVGQGPGGQRIVRFRLTKDVQLKREDLLPVAFVPLIGEHA